MGTLNMTAMIVFDNKCYLCIKFANAVRFLTRGSLAMVGHYSPLGQKLRRDILDESALDMFWFINEKHAYGGRAALLPLARTIFLPGRTKQCSMDMDDECGQECKTVKSAFLRSLSLFSNSKTITLKSK